eukprot:snap_masked-scaffold_32-processed-gene-2.31-mRNA-1 protein AED:0.25 eAED:0.33 QI:0/0.5/0.66/1/0.5/0.33/3/81/433
MPLRKYSAFKYCDFLNDVIIRYSLLTVVAIRFKTKQNQQPILTDIEKHALDLHVTMPRKKRDPDMPKRPLSSYMFYSKDRRPSLQKEKPELKFGEYSKLIGEEWKVLPLEKREKYQEQSSKDKERYDEEMKVYKEKQKLKQPAPQAQPHPHMQQQNSQFPPYNHFMMQQQQQKQIQHMQRMGIPPQMYVPPGANPFFHQYAAQAQLRQAHPSLAASAGVGATGLKNDANGTKEGISQNQNQAQAMANAKYMQYPQYNPQVMSQYQMMYQHQLRQQQQQYQLHQRLGGAQHEQQQRMQKFMNNQTQQVELTNGNSSENNKQLTTEEKIALYKSQSGQTVESNKLQDSQAQLRANAIQQFHQQQQQQQQQHMGMNNIQLPNLGMSVNEGHQSLGPQQVGTQREGDGQGDLGLHEAGEDNGFNTQVDAEGQVSASW